MMSFAFYHIGDRQHFDVLTNDAKPSIFNDRGVDENGDALDMTLLINGMITLYEEVTDRPTKKSRKDVALRSRTSSRVSSKSNMGEKDDDDEDDDDDDVNASLVYKM